MAHPSGWPNATVLFRQQWIGGKGALGQIIKLDKVWKTIKKSTIQLISKKKQNKLDNYQAKNFGMLSLSTTYIYLQKNQPNVGLARPLTSYPQEHIRNMKSVSIIRCQSHKLVNPPKSKTLMVSPGNFSWFNIDPNYILSILYESSFPDSQALFCSPLQYVHGMGIISVDRTGRHAWVPSWRLWRRGPTGAGRWFSWLSPWYSHGILSLISWNVWVIYI